MNTEQNGVFCVLVYGFAHARLVENSVVTATEHAVGTLDRRVAELVDPINVAFVSLHTVSPSPCRVRRSAAVPNVTSDVEIVVLFKRSSTSPDWSRRDTAANDAGTQKSVYEWSTPWYHCHRRDTDPSKRYRSSDRRKRHDAFCSPVLKVSSAFHWSHGRGPGNCGSFSDSPRDRTPDRKALAFCRIGGASARALR